MPRLILALSCIALLFMVVAYVLNYFFPANRYAKYMPAGLAFLSGVYYLIRAGAVPAEGFQDLASLLIAMMFGAGFLGGLGTALYLDYRKAQGR